MAVVQSLLVTSTPLNLTAGFFFLDIIWQNGHPNRRLEADYWKRGPADEATIDGPVVERIVKKQGHREIDHWTNQNAL